MTGTVPARPAALALTHGPHVLNRPEGAWSDIGVLERSSIRLKPQAIAHVVEPAPDAPTHLYL